MFYFASTFKYFVVFPGWNGKHCTLEGCPKGCSGHGQCKTNHALEWECWCDSGWFGAGCDIPLERDCSDRRDIDQGKTFRKHFCLPFTTLDFDGDGVPKSHVLDA